MSPQSLVIRRRERGFATSASHRQQCLPRGTTGEVRISAVGVQWAWALCRKVEVKQAIRGEGTTSPRKGRGFQQKGLHVLEKEPGGQILAYRHVWSRRGELKAYEKTRKWGDSFLLPAPSCLTLLSTPGSSSALLDLSGLDLPPSGTTHPAMPLQPGSQASPEQLSSAVSLLDDELMSLGEEGPRPGRGRSGGVMPQSAFLPLRDVGVGVMHCTAEKAEARGCDITPVKSHVQSGKAAGLWLDLMSQPHLGSGGSGKTEESELAHGIGSCPGKRSALSPPLRGREGQHRAPQLPL